MPILHRDEKRDALDHRSDKQTIHNNTNGQEDGDLTHGDVIALDGTIVNASGHRDQLQRHYGFFSICGLALSVDNAWVAIGTSLNVAICMF